MISSSGCREVVAAAEMITGPHSHTTGGGVQKHGSVPQLSPEQSACEGGLTWPPIPTVWMGTPLTCISSSVDRSIGVLRLSASIDPYTVMSKNDPGDRGGAHGDALSFPVPGRGRLGRSRKTR